MALVLKACGASLWQVRDMDEGQWLMAASAAGIPKPTVAMRKAAIDELRSMQKSHHYMRNVRRT